MHSTFSADCVWRGGMLDLVIKMVQHRVSLRLDNRLMPFPPKEPLELNGMINQEGQFV